MTKAPLATMRILVLEDDYYLADDASEALRDAGATVLGPFSSTAEAIASLEVEVPHCAILDVNLGQGPSFAVAEEMRLRRIPVVFMTGYDQIVIPADFADVPRIEKPTRTSDIIAAVTAACVGRSDRASHSLSKDIGSPAD